MTASGTRRLTNLVIDRWALLRLSVPFMLMVVLSVAIVGIIRWRVMQALQATELTGIENLGAMNALLDLQRTITTIGAIGLLILGVICLGLWLLYSHRIFGPTIPIRRHIEKLIEGDYTSRVQLRSSDELKDIGSELNRLAEVLASRSKS